MELICPNCQQRLSIAEQYAGQLMKCPRCAGTFTAPTLAETPAASPKGPVATVAETPGLPPTAPGGAPPAPTTGGDVYSMGSEIPKPPNPYQPAPSPIPPLPKPTPRIPEPVPSGPPGDYRRSFTLRANPQVVQWFGPGGLGLLLLLSFLPWFSNGLVSFTPWELAFSQGNVLMILFLIATVFLALPLAWVAFFMARQFIPIPPALHAIYPFRTLIIAAVALVGFVFLFINYLDCNLAAVNPSTIWYKLAFRAGLVGIAGLFFEFWLQRRQTVNLPLPKIEGHW